MVLEAGDIESMQVVDARMVNGGVTRKCKVDARQSMLTEGREIRVVGHALVKLVAQ
ncbi:hypothetical protein D3C83_80330 [compost metagenome]